MLTLRFDGLYRQIEGETRASCMCYAWLIVKNGHVVARGYGAYAGGANASSNSAEYLALIDGLDALLDMGARNEVVMVLGDAKSVIEQMNGAAGVNAPAARLLYRRAKQLEREFTRLSWCWTPRRFNKAADQLTRHAMSQAHTGLMACLNGARNIARDRRAPIAGLLPLVDFRMYGGAD